jgi:hypothetical protein
METVYMQTLRRLKWNFVILIQLFIIIFTPIETLAEEDHLITRILEADYPPDVYVATKNPVTLFEFKVGIQIENPTQSDVEVNFVCTPLPFPQVNTTLKNNTLTVSQDAVFEWVVGEYFLPPGKIDMSASIAFWIEPYQNTSLPLGVYEFWFDYIFCGSVPVPVITEKMYVDVSETTVTYYFDYNNESRIVSPKPQETNFSVSILISFSLFVAIRIYLFNPNKRRNKVCK